MTGVLVFIKKNFLLLLILGLGTVSFLRTCGTNKRIDKAIKKLNHADSLLNIARQRLDSANVKLDSANYYANSALGNLKAANNSLEEAKDITNSSLKTIHISMDNVNAIDKNKKVNEEEYRKQINLINAKINELQNKINNAKVQK